MKDTSPTSWQNVSKWYNKAVGEKGHYYHQTLIIPNVLKLLNFPENTSSSLLDLACGQGVLSRYLPSHVLYVGVDIAGPLIDNAKRFRCSNSHQFIQADVTKKISLKYAPFSHGSIILALQNIEHPLAVFKNANDYLQVGAPLIIVINHPCFRIPRQSSWGIDENNKIQYRRIDRYMSPLKIPIQMHPGKGQQSEQTLSFHYPLSKYSLWLKEAGFIIELLDEWCSDKISQGSVAKMENRSRKEIPMFMAIVARKHGGIS